jgi:hypothetical protein
MYKWIGCHMCPGKEILTAQIYIENVIIKHNWLIMMHTLTVVFVWDVLFINCNANKWFGCHLCPGKEFLTAQIYIENVIINHNWLIMMHTLTVVFVCDVLPINCNAKKNQQKTFSRFLEQSVILVIHDTRLPQKQTYWIICCTTDYFQSLIVLRV